MGIGNDHQGRGDATIGLGEGEGEEKREESSWKVMSAKVT